VVLAALVGASLAEASTATLNKRARLRAAPGASSELIAWLPQGLSVDVLGERAGWREVQSPHGRGWIWGEHLDPGGAAAPAPPPVEAPAEGPKTLQEEVRALRDEVRALRERPPAATAGDLDRLRGDLERLLASERSGAATGASRVPPLDPVDPPPDGATVLFPVLLLMGGAVGWVASRLAQRHRDRRQRNRIRF
jgi:hypothetical protein